MATSKNKQNNFSVPLGKLLTVMGNHARNTLEQIFLDELKLFSPNAESKNKLNDWIENTSIADLSRIWRKQLGPRYFHNSVLSVHRQAEIIEQMYRPLEVYQLRKRQLLEKIAKEEWESLSQNKLNRTLEIPAWSSPNTTPGRLNRRLQIGLKNYGCEYWRNNDGIGCYNCGYCVSAIPRSIKISKSNLSEYLFKQFFNAVKKHWDDSFGVIDFVSDGSFLNDDEIPIEAQDRILKYIANNIPNLERVLIESRPEHINPERIGSIIRILNGKKLEIAIGLETADSFVSIFCINKGYYLNDLKLHNSKFIDLNRLLGKLSKYKNLLSLQFYILLKPAFLTEAEALVDAVNTGMQVMELSKQFPINISIKIEPTVISYGSLLEVLNDTYITPEKQLHIIPEDGLLPCSLRHASVIQSAPSYWTVLEVFCQLYAGRASAICRVGAREDMDRFREIPAIYDGVVLNSIDALVYNAVQQLNVRPLETPFEIVGLLETVSNVLDDPSFRRWLSLVAQPEPRIMSLCKQFSHEIFDERIRRDEDGTSSFYKAIRSISEELTNSLDVRESAFNTSNGIINDDSDREKMRKKLHTKISNIIQRHLPFVDRTGIAIEDLESFSGVSPTVRFRVRLQHERFPLQIADIWVIIPMREIQMINDERVEIERKWIIDDIPDGLLNLPNPYLQAYLAISRTEEVRIRRRIRAENLEEGEPLEFLMTCKSGFGRKRIEYETLITQKIFEEFFPAAVGRVIEKDRYIIEDIKKVPELEYLGEKVIIELDIYKGKLFGLKTAEVEFNDEEKALAFKPPSWFGTEVTLDKRLKNQSLAREGMSNILLTPNPRFSNTVLMHTPNIDDPIVNEIGNVCDSFESRYELLVNHNAPIYIGGIQAETADAVRSCALAIIDLTIPTPEILAWIALRKQVGMPYIVLPKTGSKDQKQFNIIRQRIQNHLEDQKKLLISPKSIKQIPMSELIARQRLVDNDLLATIEEKAFSVSVITTTLEFDIGELEETVKTNLHRGINYSYYLPADKHRRSMFPLLRANIQKFKRVYDVYREKITFYELPENFIPYYREVVMYYDKNGQPTFAFTYLEPRSIDNELELIQLPVEQLIDFKDKFLCLGQEIQV